MIIYITRTVAADAPFKMSQWMGENECATQGQTYPDKSMTRIFVGWVLLYKWTNIATWCSLAGTACTIISILLVRQD